MIMVEALVQQLAAARAHGCPSAGAPPSELREKQVQTDHTELSQVKTHLVSFKRLTVGDVNHLELAVHHNLSDFLFFSPEVIYSSLSFICI